ncbi:MAG: hypothetical protein WC539_08350 [Nitrospirota bacterium]
MKKECAHTRKMLPKYLHGHLFKLEQLRIERHLRACVVCHSQYETLKRADETRRFLKDITPPESVIQRVKEGVTSLSKLKKIVYRPLWILAILIAIAAGYYFLVQPRELDIELEKIAQQAVPVAEPVASPEPPRTKTVTPPLASAPVAVQPSRIETDALMITIITEGSAGVRRINEVMRGHGHLRKFKFTDMVREISGNLTAKELVTFFNRIEAVAKIDYDKKRLESFSSAYQIPFIITLKVVAPPPGKKADVQQPEPAKKSSEDVAPSSLPSATAPSSSGAR